MGIERKERNQQELHDCSEKFYFYLHFLPGILEDFGLVITQLSHSLYLLAATLFTPCLSAQFGSQGIFQ